MARARVRRILAALALPPLALVAAFLAGSARGTWRVPDAGALAGPRATRATGAPPRELVVVAWNVAKARAHLGGASFAPAQDVRDRLARMAELLARESPDLVFLSEVLRECGPCPVDQVAELARLLDLPHWAFGECYAFGLPGYRIRNGNALLSRFPLAPRANVQLAGARPFWSPTNNRRALLCDVDLGDGLLRAVSVRNDSFDPANNARQAGELAALLAGRPALLAGDLNAEPGGEALAALRATGLFAGGFDGPPTFPASAPRRRIDYVLAPRGWTVVEERVLPSELSDHRPVVARLARP